MFVIEEDAYLAHYGVPGMKWGKRNNNKSTKRKLTPKQELKRKQIRNERIKFGAAVGVLTTSKLILDMDANPERYKPAAAFLGKSMRTLMKVAVKAAKGMKILFDRSGGMTVYAPGKFTPGTLKDVTYVPRMLGTASEFVYRGHVR